MREKSNCAVTLPHDAMLSEKRTPESAGGKNTGWVESNDYVYEKLFFAPQEWSEKEIVFVFEGVYRNAKVYLNGKLAGGTAYGYTGFIVKTQGFLKYGQQNEIRVEAFNSDQPNSRWYSGAGILRPVWLYVYPKRHIEYGGVRIRTLDYEKRLVRVEVKTNAAGKIRIEMPFGAEYEREIDGEASAEFMLPQAQLWSPESPVLYTCRVTFGEDVQEETFGIRTVTCTPARGMCINGKRVILRGACIHSDNGILGGISHPFADARKIALLKEAGYNAIRSAHNPCSVATLEACDRLGMLVLDEYADMWYIHKTKYDYAMYLEKEWKKDLAAMVEKDFNHPSVVMYSIGNEVAETGEKRGIALADEMTKFLHSLDDRPVTCGINIFFNLLYGLGFGVYSDKKAQKQGKKKKAVGSEFFNNLAGLLGATTMKIGATMPGCDAKTRGAFAVLDVAGYNYGILRYKRDMKKYPHRIIVGSETFCADARRFWVTAQKYPALIGDFVWAGIDYLGEVAVGAWEHADYAPDFKGGVGWVSSGSGRLDLNGRQLAEALYTRAAFDLDPVRMGSVRPDRAFDRHSPSAWKLSGALESWSWEGCDGAKTSVEVFSAETYVELYCNGKRVGRRKMPKNARTCFKIRYQHGELTAVCYDKAGREKGRTTLNSAGKETKLTLLPEKQSFGAGDLCYIRLQYTDEKGTLKPLVRGEISVRVEGGELLALGSACPYNERGYLTDKTDTYYGEALAIVRPSGKGDVRLWASSAYGEGSVCIKNEM